MLPSTHVDIVCAVLYGKELLLRSARNNRCRVARRALLWGSLFAATAAVTGTSLVARNSEAGLAPYQRADAPKEACRAAVAGIVARIDLAASFVVGDCAAPMVTQVRNRPSEFIVTVVVEPSAASGNRQRQTYSVMMDGRASDGWRFVAMKAAPNALVLDASALSVEPRLQARR